MSFAEDPPDPPYPKLPFRAAVSLSYSTYFEHFTEALRASWFWLIVVAALTGVANWLQWSWMAAVLANLKPGPPPQFSTPTGFVLLSNLTNLFFLFAGVSIAVAWHRLMILSERPCISGANVATSDLWHYVGMAIAIVLINFLPAAVIVLPMFSFLFPPAGSQTPPGFLALLLLVFVFYAVGTAAAFRLSLLLPARAVGDRRLTFKQTWGRSRGNTWRLFWGIVATTTPPLLFAEIVFLVAIGPPNPGSFASENFATRMTAVSMVFSVYYLLILPIGIGFLSHAYRHFFRAPLETT
jgi:hypothetical protein